MEKESYSWLLIVLILLLLGSSMLMGSHMGFGMGIGFVLMLLFWVAVFWLVFSLLGAKKETKTPLDTIKVRYAKGEITKRRFERLKRELDE